MPAPDTTAALVDEALDPDASAVEKADVAVTLKAAQWRDHPVVKAAGFASEVADQPPALALSAGVLAYGLLAGRPKAAEVGLRMGASVLVAIALKTAIKRAIARTRPYKVLDEGEYAVEALGPYEGPWNSFPSGHTADAVAMARALSRAHPPAARAGYALAAAIGAVQVPRGKHYPIDVAAGALVGLAAEAAVDRAARALPRAF